MNKPKTRNNIFCIGIGLVCLFTLIFVDNVSGFDVGDGIKGVSVIDNSSEQITIQVETYVTSPSGTPILSVSLYEGSNCGRTTGRFCEPNVNNYFDITVHLHNMENNFVSLKQGNNITFFVFRLKDNTPSQVITRSICVSLCIDEHNKEGIPLYCPAAHSHKEITRYKAWGKIGKDSGFPPPNSYNQYPNRPTNRNLCLDEQRSCMSNCERKYRPRSYSVTTRGQFQQCKENCDLNYFKCTHRNP